MGKTRDLRETVKKELSDDPILGTADITVENIDGDVALCGAVRSYSQYLEATAAAWRVAGVTHVRNHLEVSPPPGDVRDDAMLTTAANNSSAARWYPMTVTWWSIPAGTRSRLSAMSGPGPSATPSSAPPGGPRRDGRRR